jgi:hypothetical protein
LPRVFHWTQTTQRKRLRVQPSSDANSTPCLSTLSLLFAISALNA